MCSTIASKQSGVKQTTPAASKKPTKGVSLGSSPRIFPRPEYPPWTKAVWSLIYSNFYQAGVHGAVLCLILFPIYTACRSFAIKYEISNQVFFALLLSSAHTLPYTTNNFFYWLCDEFKWFQSYKLERKEYMKAKPALMTKMATEALIGQLVTGPIFAYLLYPAFVHFGMLDLDAPLPTFASMFKTFVVGYTFNDVGFYFTHRLFHSKLLYKRFHKQHHEFVGTVSFSAEYADPVEIIIANQIPTVGGVLFFACHPLSVSVWIMMRLQQTYEAHSGYCFENTLLAKVGILHPGSAVFHDHHHTSNMGNFGSFFLDWAFGTMDHYLSAGGYRGYIDKKKKGGV